MKLANLSICLVLAFVLGGCFGGTKSQNITPEPQSLADLQLQPLSLDRQGKFTAQSIKELKGVADVKITEPTIILANNIADKTIANIGESVAKSQIKQAITLVDTANNTLIHIAKPTEPNTNKRPKPALKPASICERRPDVCFSKGLEKYKNCSNCLLERIECKQETNCLATLLAEAEKNRGKVFTLAEANEAMFAIYDANITNSKVEKASIQRKAKQ